MLTTWFTLHAFPLLMLIFVHCFQLLHWQWIPKTLFPLSIREQDKHLDNSRYCWHTNHKVFNYCLHNKTALCRHTAGCANRLTGLNNSKLMWLHWLELEISCLIVLLQILLLYKKGRQGCGRQELCYQASTLTLGYPIVIRKSWCFNWIVLTSNYKLKPDYSEKKKKHMNILYNIVNCLSFCQILPKQYNKIWAVLQPTTKGLALKPHDIL